MFLKIFFKKKTKTNFFKIQKMLVRAKHALSAVFRSEIKKHPANLPISLTQDHLLHVLPYGYVPEPSPNHAMERIFGCFVYNEKKEIKIII